MTGWQNFRYHTASDAHYRETTSTAESPGPPDRSSRRASDCEPRRSMTGSGRRETDLSAARRRPPGVLRGARLPFFGRLMARGVMQTRPCAPRSGPARDPEWSNLRDFGAANAAGFRVTQEDVGSCIQGLAVGSRRVCFDAQAMFFLVKTQTKRGRETNTRRPKQPPARDRRPIERGRRRRGALVAHHPPAAGGINLRKTPTAAGGLAEAEARATPAGQGLDRRQSVAADLPPPDTNGPLAGGVPGTGRP